VLQDCRSAAEPSPSRGGSEDRVAVNRCRRLVPLGASESFRAALGGSTNCTKVVDPPAAWGSGDRKLPPPPSFFIKRDEWKTGYTLGLPWGLLGGLGRISWAAGGLSWPDKILAAAKYGLFSSYLGDISSY
jgi:hypothetical protein